MLVTDHFVYLQMQKTGSTRIAEIFQELCGGEYVGRKHGNLSGRPKGKFVVGSIRNPWAWYVSLWAFGCMGRGKVYADLVRGNGHWRELYQDAYNPELFRPWLTRLYDEQGSVMTKRYDYFYPAGLVDVWVKTDLMHVGIHEAVERAGYERVLLSDVGYMTNTKTNTSNHLPYQTYYDDRTNELIHQHEKGIIEAHGFA